MDELSNLGLYKSDGGLFTDAGYKLNRDEVSGLGNGIFGGDADSMTGETSFTDFTDGISSFGDGEGKNSMFGMDFGGMTGGMFGDIANTAGSLFGGVESLMQLRGLEDKHKLNKKLLANADLTIAENERRAGSQAGFDSGWNIG